jgi:hypothetical protein
MATTRRRCRCGASETKLVFVSERAGAVRRTYYRCTECAYEWTEVQTVPDVDEPVTSDEVISVHKTLANPNLTMEDLLHAT